MMKNTLNVTLIVLLLVALVGGVAAPASAAIISEAQEISIGQQAAAQLEAEVPVLNDPAWTQHVTAIGLRLAAVTDRRSLPWTFKILNTDKVNAISLPGGFIYVTRGMLTFLQSQDELAFILGHEIGHVERRHHVALIERDFFFTLVLQMLFGGSPSTAQIGSFVRVLASRGFSREAEFQADLVGTTITHRAGFNAGAGLAFMERMRIAEGRDPSQVETFFSTHPGLADRIIRVRELLRRLGYQVAAQAPAAPPMLWYFPQHMALAA